MDADMSISIAKTKVLHTRRQDEVSKTTDLEASKARKYTCPHGHCDYKLYSKKDMQIHAGKCKWTNTFQIEKILDYEGPPTTRKYLIKWQGYPREFNSWEPRGYIHPSEITAFEKTNDIFDYSWQHRCPVCELPMKSQRGVKIHLVNHCKIINDANQQQDFTGRLADKTVKTNKVAEQQASRLIITCENKRSPKKCIQIQMFGYDVCS